MNGFALEIKNNIENEIVTIEKVLYCDELDMGIKGYIQQMESLTRMLNIPTSLNSGIKLNLMGRIGAPEKERPFNITIELKNKDSCRIGVETQVTVEVFQAHDWPHWKISFNNTPIH